MFHTTEGVVGYDGQAILLKRTFDTRIALHPFHGFRNLAEDNVQLCHLLWIRLTVQRPDGVAIPYGSFFLEFTCYERIEVDRNRVFAIAENAFVTIDLYNSLGVKVKNITSDDYQAGNYTLTFSVDNLPQGLYFYVMNANGYVDSKTLIVK